MDAAEEWECTWREAHLPRAPRGTLRGGEVEYESAKNPDARLHDQRPQLETGRMAPAQHGCSQRDETGAAWPLSLTWDPDSHKGSGLFLFPPPFILCFKLYDFIIANTC